MLNDDADRTLNIFGRNGYEGVRCAVPADRPIPDFILRGTWRFEAHYARTQLPLAPSAKDAAFRMTEMNGFYFFTDFNAG